MSLFISSALGYDYHSKPVGLFVTIEFLLLLTLLLQIDDILTYFGMISVSISYINII